MRDVEGKGKVFFCKRKRMSERGSVDVGVCEDLRGCGRVESS